MHLMGNSRKNKPPSTLQTLLDTPILELPPIDEQIKLGQLRRECEIFGIPTHWAERREPNHSDTKTVVVSSEMMRHMNIGAMGRDEVAHVLTGRSDWTHVEQNYAADKDEYIYTFRRGSGTSVVAHPADEFYCHCDKAAHITAHARGIFVGQCNRCERLWLVDYRNKLKVRVAVGRKTHWGSTLNASQVVNFDLSGIGHDDTGMAERFNRLDADVVDVSVMCALAMMALTIRSHMSGWATAFHEGSVYPTIRRELFPLQMLTDFIPDDDRYPPDMDNEELVPLVETTIIGSSFGALRLMWMHMKRGLQASTLVQQKYVERASAIFNTVLEIRDQDIDFKKHIAFAEAARNKMERMERRASEANAQMRDFLEWQQETTHRVPWRTDTKDGAFKRKATI